MRKCEGTRPGDILPVLVEEIGLPTCCSFSTAWLPRTPPPYNRASMALASGTHLGTYEVIGLLGAGGMGEVYRARDTKLGRHVALKTLPDRLTHDAERLARFRREAHVLAALNHPHIAGIYGFEEADGQRFLVLELVEGETLAARLEQGPLPVGEALAIAREIAEALEAAHEKGIIHRDLKPANIALTPHDRVKVLDFGLAKAADAAATPDGSDPVSSPTVTSPAMLTGLGVILGTAAYMSPEQARGRAADKRSDVWSFGCVLFEMLSGKRAFEGQDVSDTLPPCSRATRTGARCLPLFRQPCGRSSQAASTRTIGSASATSRRHSSS